MKEPEPVVILEQEIRGKLSSQSAVSDLIDKLGWPELLGCLAVTAETEALLW